MPISLPPFSRRRFLAASLAAGVSLVFPRRAPAVATDPHRIAFFSDLHLAADRKYVHKTGTIPWENIQQATRETLALSPAPSAVLINGDCSLSKGLAEEYACVIDALRPLRQAGLPIHITLGNHDERQNFWKFVAPQRPQIDMPRHLGIFETPRANVFLLDSLDVTDKTPGTLGKDQLEWLRRQLDARADKPALVMAHHDVDLKPKGTGLTDSKALLDILLPRKHVKVYIFGHTHNWRHAQMDGFHLLNLPTTAYIFDKTSPIGWVDAQLRRDGASFKLCALDTKHPQHGRAFDLKWR